MIPVLYAANTTDFSSFGLGVLTDTISCEVTEERNGVFECLLKYPVSGQHYGLITKECIIKAKPNDTAADQAFRIYRITKPLNGIITIYGQHISYDLANVPVMPFSTESRSPQLILSQLLAGDTRFTGWTDYSDAKSFSVTQPKSVRACLGGTEGSMLSKWHGEFEWDNFTVKFHSHRGQKTGVVIEYGKNLTALEQDEDNSGVYTALLPYAVYTPEGSDTETVVTLPEVTLPIVTSEIVRAKTLIMDFSDQFDGVVTEEALRAKANSYIKANPLGATIPTVKVSFEPLWKQPEYSALLERVNLCDTVTIRHSALGVSVSAMVIETVYDTLAERYKSISLGQSKSSMITTISEVQSTVDKVESTVGRFPMKTEHASMQYSIRPFSDFLEEELLKFARSCPDQWQVKILLLLSFKNIRSLDDIASNCSFPDLCILKALLVAQEYNLVLNISNGWLLNEKLDVEYLNQYLSIDILDYKLLAEDVFKRKLAQNNVSQEVKASKHEKGDTLTSDYNFTLKAHYAQKYNNSYDDLARNERSVDGYGRKRRNEWNNTEALSLNKEVRNRIKKLNAERNEAYNATHSQAKTSTSSRKYSEKSEKLYAELCTEFPEYEDYIDRCHKIDPSYGQMLQVKMKIYADNGYDKFGMRNEDWNIGRFSE